FSDLFVCYAKLSSQVANLRVEILIPDDGCYHADCNDHGHCKGGDRRDPPLQSSDGSKDAHDENNEHAKNNEADSPFPDRQFVLTHVALAVAGSCRLRKKPSTRASVNGEGARNLAPLRQ